MLFNNYNQTCCTHFVVLSELGLDFKGVFRIISLQKLARRQAAANRINYGQRSKERINQILNMDYMSSEETDDEADVDSTQPRTRAVRRRKVRQLPGESHQLKQLKTDLDTYYWTRIATPLGSAQRAHVVRPATLVSNRTIPQTPSWASNASDE